MSSVTSKSLSENRVLKRISGSSVKSNFESPFTQRQTPSRTKSSGTVNSDIQHMTPSQAVSLSACTALYSPSSLPRDDENTHVNHAHGDHTQYDSLSSLLKAKYNQHNLKSPMLSGGVCGSLSDLKSSSKLGSLLQGLPENYITPSYESDHFNHTSLLPALFSGDRDGIKVIGDSNDRIVQGYMHQRQRADGLMNKWKRSVSSVLHTSMNVDALIKLNVLALLLCFFVYSLVFPSSLLSLILPNTRLINSSHLIILRVIVTNIVCLLAYTAVRVISPRKGRT